MNADCTRTAIPTAQRVAGFTGGKINKVALVSHDYNIADSRELKDYSEHLHRINKLCDEQGCDTILYALYTWDEDSTASRTHAAIFESLRHVERVIVEVMRQPVNPDQVEVLLRGQEDPVVAFQRFATSSSPDADKQAFLNDLPARLIGDALLMICGETNIASLVRGSEEFYDPYDFAGRLRTMNVRLILNPIHDYMRRYEMGAAATPT